MEATKEQVSKPDPAYCMTGKYFEKQKKAEATTLEWQWFYAITLQQQQQLPNLSSYQIK
jgi:hypothetical protein